MHIGFAVYKIVYMALSYSAVYNVRISKAQRAAQKGRVINMIKYGVCNWCLPVEGPDACDMISRLHLDGMHVRFTDELKENMARYKAKSRELGIEYPTIGMSLFGKHSYTDKNGRAFFVEQIKRAVDMCHELGCRTIQIPAFGDSLIKTPEDLKNAALCMQDACALAQEAGLLVATENALGAEDNVEFFRLVGMDNFKFYFDTQNTMKMSGVDSVEVLRAVKDKMCEMHVKDCSLAPGSTGSMALGEGDTGFARIMDYVKSIGYPKWIVLENEYSKGALRDSYPGDMSHISKDIATVKAICEPA